MRAVLVFLFLMSASVAYAGRASRYFDYFNTDAFWNRLEMDPQGKAPTLFESDTCILVASNRARGTDSLRFMSEERGDGPLRYFVVYSRNGKWHLRPCATLREGFGLVGNRQPRPWVVYTEGMGKIFTGDLDRGMRMAGEYGVNVLLLDYPSIHTGYGSFRNYRFAWNNSIANYKDFAQIFDTLRSLRNIVFTGPASLFFHSMGNNLMRKLVQKKLLRDLPNAMWVDNLILNAACVPRRGSKRWVDSLNFAKRVFVNYNPEDRVLKLASIAGFRGLLGLGPKRRVSQNATYINFNGVAGYGHSNFMGLYGRPFPPAAAMAHYRLQLRGQGLPINDTTRYKMIGNHGNMLMLQ